jgi:hypothetical protein
VKLLWSPIDAPVWFRKGFLVREDLLCGVFAPCINKLLRTPRKMSNAEDHHPAVEQSWIVLDEQGWANSRPPTASPSRPGPRLSPFKVENDEEEEGQPLSRRLGMDRDVREALELAERSLELAGSADEFAPRRTRANSDEDAQRSSPYSQPLSRNAMGWGEDSVEDRYNGRAPPLIKRAFAISTDSEHVAFQNIRLVGGSTVTADEQPNQFAADASSSIQSVEGGKADHRSSPLIPLIRSYDIDTLGSISEGEEEGSFLQWMFGLQSNSSTYPLVLSHALTLVVGFYLGFRRGAIVTSTSSTQNSAAMSGVSQQ